MEHHHVLFGTFLIIDHLPLSISLVQLLFRMLPARILLIPSPGRQQPKQHRKVGRPTQQGTQAISCQRIVFKGYINQLHVQTIIAPTWGWLWNVMDGCRNPVRLCGEIKLAILGIKTGHSWNLYYPNSSTGCEEENVQYVTTHNFNYKYYSFHPNHSGGADWICSETMEAVDFLDPTESTQLFSMSGLKLYCRWQRRKCHRQPHPQKSQQNCREGAPTALKPHEAANFPHGFLRKSGIYPNVWLLFMGEMCFSGYHGIYFRQSHMDVSNCFKR